MRNFRKITTIISLFTVLFGLYACGDSSDSKLAYLKRKTPEEREAMQENLLSLARSGDTEAQLLYMISTNKCEITNTTTGMVTFQHLVEKKNPFAQFLSARVSYARYASKECLYFDSPNYYIDSVHQFQALTSSANQGFLPAKIFLAHLYVKEEENGFVPDETNITEVRDLLNDVIFALQTEEISAVQHQWTHKALEAGFNGTDDPILRIQRLQALTLLNPDWQKPLDWTWLYKPNKDDPEKRRLLNKFKLMNEVLQAKYQSLKQLPFDDDAKRSIAIADKLLAQANNQLSQDDGQLTPRDKRTIRNFSAKIGGKRLAKIEEKRQQFTELEQRAKQGDSEAMTRVFYQYKRLPAYKKQVKELLEKFTDLAILEKDKHATAIITDKRNIKDEEKRINILRKCAYAENITCMHKLAETLIYKDAKSYPEGIHWVYQAMAYGDKKAQALLKRIPRRHKLNNWVIQFMQEHYPIYIPDELACHAALFLESKEESRQNGWSDKISFPALVTLFERGALASKNHDCAARLTEHYRYIHDAPNAQKWKARQQSWQ